MSYCYISDTLLHDRIIYLTGHITKELAEDITSKMFYLEHIDPNADIRLMINSTGGEVLAGLFILDVMNSINPDVCTFSCGQSASMAAVLLSNGTKGKRYSYPNSEIMLHTVSASYFGKEQDIEVSVDRIRALNHRLLEILAHNCNKSYEQIEQDLDRDFFMTAQEALDYGVIDKTL